MLADNDKGGFIFYTNYGSRKGQELEANPKAALVFYWEPIKRSVRVEGNVERVSVDQSEAYFHSRPIGSQIGAAVSEQSKVIADRSVLEDKGRQLQEEYGAVSGKTLSKPESWGGYRVIPKSVEFWQGQSTRIHDRIRFRLIDPSDNPDPTLFIQGDNGWIIERLSP